MTKTKYDWKKAPPEITIGGLRCIESTFSISLPNEPLQRDRSLCGRYGQIWPQKDGSYFVLIWSKKIQNKIIELTGSNKKPGPHAKDELILYIEEPQLKDVIDLLRVPKSAATQIRLAHAV